MFGQTMLDGERMKPYFRDTTLPYFQPGDRSLESLGLIINSFVKGLNIAELWYQAMDGRSVLWSARSLRLGAKDRFLTQIAVIFLAWHCFC